MGKIASHTLTDGSFLKILYTLFLVSIFSFSSYAQQNYSLRLASGKASPNDLGEIVLGDIGRHQYNLKVYALDGGYLLDKNYLDGFSFYLKGGVAYFDEKIFEDSYEVTLYLKAYYDLPYFSKIFRLGFGEGGSYTTHTLLTEYLEAQQKGDNNSKYLNYLDISFDFELGRFFNAEQMQGFYFGYAIKHRSGIFGLINNVEHGGSNYNTLYIEKNF